MVIAILSSIACSTSISSQDKKEEYMQYEFPILSDSSSILTCTREMPEVENPYTNHFPEKIIIYSTDKSKIISLKDDCSLNSERYDTQLYFCLEDDSVQIRFTQIYNDNSRASLLIFDHEGDQTYRLCIT